MLILSICLLWTVQYPSWMQFYLPSSLSTTSAPSLLFAQGSLRQAEQLCTRLLDHVATNNSHHTSINPHIIPKSHDIEVVDIILLVHVPKKTVYKYFLDESFMASPLFTHFMHQNKDNPQDNKVRIHMFVDSDEVKQHLSRFKFLYLHDMRDYQYLEDEFFALYKPNHHSINNVYYEFLCFYRWLLYDRMISDWNHNVTTNKDNYNIHKRSGPPIKHVLTIDSDVFLLVDVIDLFHRLFHASSVVFGQSDIELVVLSPGAFHIWTSQGLQNYASFVHRWYNDTTDNILRRTKANTGILFHVLHLSDMGMIREFSLHNHHSRSFCFVQNQLHTLANVQATRSKLQNETIEILQCIPMGVYDNFIPGNPLQYHINRTFGVVQSEYEKYPYCYMVSHYIALKCSDEDCLICVLIV